MQQGFQAGWMLAQEAGLAAEHGAEPLSAEQKALKRKQANRDSARRSKLRRKAEVEAMMAQADTLQETHSNLTRQLSAARERVAQLATLNTELRKQAADAGLNLPC